MKYYRCLLQGFCLITVTLLTACQIASPSKGVSAVRRLNAKEHTVRPSVHDLFVTNAAWSWNNSTYTCRSALYKFAIENNDVEAFRLLMRTQSHNVAAGNSFIAFHGAVDITTFWHVMAKASNVVAPANVCASWEHLENQNNNRPQDLVKSLQAWNAGKPIAAIFHILEGFDDPGILSHYRASARDDASKFYELVRCVSAGDISHNPCRKEKRGKNFPNTR